MGLYSNPLAYTGYQPQVTGKPYTTNNTVRAATQEEVDEGSKDFLYVSPLTLSSSITTDLASPPRIGNTTPNEISATTLTATYLAVTNPASGANISGYLVVDGDCELSWGDEGVNVEILCGAGGSASSTLRLGNNSSVTRIEIGDTTTTSTPRTTIINGGSQVQDDTLRLMVGAHSAGTQTLNMMTGLHTGGTQSVNILSGTSPGGTQNIRLGAAATNIGFFGATPIPKPVNTTDLRTCLTSLGLLATGGATPLNLNGGDLTANSVTVTAPTVSGASPLVNNSRAGQASFTDVITTTTFLNLTITNSNFNSSSVIQATISCATGGSAVMITRVNPTSGSCAFRVYNVGADTADNVIINFSILN